MNSLKVPYKKKNTYQRKKNILELASRCTYLYKFVDELQTISTELVYAAQKNNITLKHLTRSAEGTRKMHNQPQTKQKVETALVTSYWAMHCLKYRRNVIHPSQTRHAAWDLNDKNTTQWNRQSEAKREHRNTDYISCLCRTSHNSEFLRKNIHWYKHTYISNECTRYRELHPLS